MPSLGKKYSCYSCHTKFYDLGKPLPLCPKCGADQRDAEEAPLVTTSRRSRVVEEVEDDFESDDAPPAAPPAGDEEEDFGEAPEPEPEDDAEEEEDY